MLKASILRVIKEISECMCVLEESSRIAACALFHTTSFEGLGSARLGKGIFVLE